ncbi:hypothetical protein MCERH10_01285 [Caulobacteraceae bacterium]|jgi:hypothetical protein
MIRRSLLAIGPALAISAIASSQSFAQAGLSRHSGTWRIDASRSSFSDGTFPPNMSLTIDMTISNGRIVYGSVNDTNKTRPPSLTNFDTTLDGVPSAFLGQDRFNKISVLQLNPNEFRIMKMKDDDVIVGEFWTFLRDRRTLVRRGVGKNATGKSRVFEEYFVRTGPSKARN